MGIIHDHLVEFFARTRPNTKPFRDDLLLNQGYCQTEEHGIECKGQHAAVSYAMYDIRTWLDVLEGREEPEQ